MGDPGLDPDKVTGWWHDIKFHNLKNGDVFRLFDTAEDGTEKPDVISDAGTHQVCVALGDVKPTDDDVENYAVQTKALGGF